MGFLNPVILYCLTILNPVKGKSEFGFGLQIWCGLKTHIAIIVESNSNKEHSIECNGNIIGANWSIGTKLNRSLKPDAKKCHDCKKMNTKKIPKKIPKKKKNAHLGWKT